MARTRKRKSAPAKSATHAPESRWSALTWDDLSRWAGSRSVARGRKYQRGGNVTDLALAADGQLLASVMGTKRYITSVGFASAQSRSRRLQSTCTCPVGHDGCKHAVAVVAEYLETLANESAVPAADAEDPRWLELSGETLGVDDELDDLGNETGAFGADETGGQGAGAHRTKRRTRTEWDEKIEAHIRAKDHEALTDLVCSLVDRFPELREEFQEQISIAEGDVQRLVSQARQELLSVTEEIGWQHHWSDEGHTPNYTRLKRKLERLAQQGHCDEVVELGRELVDRGMEQVSQSHDDGETAMELADCLTVVFDALEESSLPVPDKILWAIDAVRQDEYSVIDDKADAIFDADWPAADWSVAADRLAERLNAMPAGTSGAEFSRDYRRDQSSGWLLMTLEKAGRVDEMLAVYETEARTTGSYERVVAYLISEKRLGEAERWAREGIAKVGERLPGIASALTQSLCKMAQGRKEWGVVAAHAAHKFFERPSVQGFRELVSAAKKAKCGDQVRAMAVQFLESGLCPTPKPGGGKGKRRNKDAQAWPLPVPDYLVPSPRSDLRMRDKPRPHYDVLLEMAIAEKRPDDVLHWYDKIEAANRSKPDRLGAWSGYAYASQSDRVARAVAPTHPDRALAIYRSGLESSLPHANIGAYETCADYLRKMRPILKSLGREDEWTKLVEEIRHEYRNRPRFMDILDTVDGRTIVQARKARSRG